MVRDPTKSGHSYFITSFCSFLGLSDLSKKLQKIRRPYYYTTGCPISLRDNYKNEGSIGRKAFVCQRKNRCKMFELCLGVPFRVYGGRGWAASRFCPICKNSSIENIPSVRVVLTPMLQKTWRNRSRGYLDQVLLGIADESARP